jgi:hypothetical protein
MNREVQYALEGSIKKWEGIVKGTMTDEGTENCPLCQLFFLNCGCEGCPVAEFTGRGECLDTPYDSYRKTRSIDAAKKMLVFLKSLLPKG